MVIVGGAYRRLRNPVAAAAIFPSSQNYAERKELRVHDPVIVSIQPALSFWDYGQVCNVESSIAAMDPGFLAT